MRILIFVFCLFAVSISYGQPNHFSSSDKVYFVNAPNGLIVRADASSDSEKTGELLYGMLVEVLGTSENEIEVVDGDRTIKGSYAKIQYYLGFYDIDAVDSERGKQVGFVFNGYLEPLNKAEVIYEMITKQQFDAYRSYVAKKPEAVTDFDLIKKNLDDRVTWRRYDTKDIKSIDKIKLESGKIVKLSEGMDLDCQLLAFYPEDQVLYYSCGHASDFSISIKTGETLETVGNPDYIINSPNNKNRITGSFGGQECSSYFFQEIKDGNLIYLIDFDKGLSEENNVCYFKEFKWITDTEFAVYYLGWGKEVYAKGELVKMNPKN